MDTEKYFRSLDNNTSETILLAKSCSSVQLNSSLENKWTILQILEHIFLTENVICRIITKPSELKSEQPEIFGNEKIERILLNPEARKIIAPEFLWPKGDIKSVDIFEIKFTENRKLLKQAIVSGKIIIDNRIHTHPFLGAMTISDWLYLIIHHNKRHLNQIKMLMQ